MSHTMEEVTFTRDTQAILIPDGFEVSIPEGTRGWIQQVLGGNYTVHVERGFLVRINGANADAIGKEIEERYSRDADLSADVEESQVWDELSTCYDPEIPVNIVELGLVYGCQVIELGEGEGSRVEIQMTLTAPGCGMGEVLRDDVEYKVRSIPGVAEVKVDVVFDPPWSPEKMSEAARLELGFF